MTKMRLVDLIDTLAYNIEADELPMMRLCDYANTIMGENYWSSLTNRQRTRLENGVDLRTYSYWFESDEATQPCASPIAINRRSETMNPIQAIDELIVKAQDALDLAEESVDEDAINDIWKQEEALQALKLVLAMLPVAGHDEPDTVPETVSVAQVLMAQAEIAALEWLHTMGDVGYSKIRAVKAYRAIAGTGLPETLILVNGLQEKHGL